MGLQEANELIEEYHRWDNHSCTCFQNAPCPKCVGRPAPELYQEAMETVNNRKKLIADECDRVIGRYKNIFSGVPTHLKLKYFVTCAHEEISHKKDLLSSYAGLVDIEYDYQLAEDMETHLDEILLDLEG